MRRGSIRGTLVAIYLLTMLIALTLGLGIYQMITANDRMAKKYLGELEVTNTCEDFLKIIINEVNTDTLELTLNKKVEYALGSDKLENNPVIKRVLSSWVLKNPEVKTVHMLSLSRKLLSESSVSTSKYQESGFRSQFSYEVLQKIDQQEGQVYVGVGSDFTGEDYNKTLYVGRRINSSDTLNKIGYMFYFLDEEVLREYLEPYLKRNKAELVIVDSQGHVMNFGESTQLQTRYSTYRGGGYTPDEMKKWENKYDHAQIESSAIGLTLIGGYIEQTLDSDMINIVIALSFINLIFLLIAIVAIKWMVINPLEKISNKARQISEEGTLSIRFDLDSKYREGNIIAEALNEMLNRIKELITEGEEKERQQRILELSVINHQVNPHFLFNTLNSVSLLIAVEDKKLAQKLVKSLAKYYRVCLTQENNTNTISQEMDIMREYIHIAELKNPNLIRLHLRVDENLYSKKVPRMILQILVENSIKYGIKTIDEPLEIKVDISADYENKKTIILIRDNGKGMEEQIKQDILKGVQLKDKSGFGLKSTIKRISLMYEIEDVNEIIHIESKLNEYTEIVFFIPWEQITRMDNKDTHLFEKQDLI